MFKQHIYSKHTLDAIILESQTVAVQNTDIIISINLLLQQNSTSAVRTSIQIQSWNGDDKADSTSLYLRYITY